MHNSMEILQRSDSRKQNMIKVNILYPNTPDGKFNMDYYLNTHMPDSIERLSRHPGFQGVSVERGVEGETPQSQPSFKALCHFRFTTMKDFVEAFGPHAEFLQGDMLNYTNIKPSIQWSEIEIER